MAHAAPGGSSLIILIVLTVVVGGLVGAGLTEFARRGSRDPKLSMLLAGVSAMPAALHVPSLSIRAAARGARRRRAKSEAPDEVDVELAVREHLYGGRGRSL